MMMTDEEIAHMATEVTVLANRLENEIDERGDIPLDSGDSILDAYAILGRLYNMAIAS